MAILITFLSSPKPFVGVAKPNQTNAIINWTKLHADAEVIIYGNSEGTAEVCKELGVWHVPDIECNSEGIPFFDAIVNHASQNAKNDIQVYANCDMLFSEHFVGAMGDLELDSYLVIGQRSDLKEDVSFDINQPDWLSYIETLLSEGKIALNTPHAKDYFVFRRGLFDQIGKLVIGRGGYDCALVAYCLRRHIPVIDATLAVLAVHQYHDYSHAASGWSEVMTGKDCQFNNRTHGIVDTLRTSDAGYRLYRHSLSRNRAGGDWLRYLELCCRFQCRMEWSVYFFRPVWHVLVRAGLYRPPYLNLSDVISALSPDYAKPGARG
jgi:hypothetical protein